MRLKIIDKILLRFIKIYQKTISPDHGFIAPLFPLWKCVKYPSCSEYMKIIIEKKGFYIGLKQGFKRIMSCH